MLRGGRLEKSAGKDDFQEYSVHGDLRRKIEGTFARPISYRLIYGATGEGKTWTLSWVWREFEGMKVDGGNCMVLAVPKFELRRQPERFLIESLAHDVTSRYPDLFPVAARSKKASSDLKVVAAYLQDPDGQLVLTGRGTWARPPRLEGLPAISMNLISDLLRVFLAIVEAAGLTGHPWLLVLVDELEGPFTLQAGKGVTIFSDFLRDVYDNLEKSRPNFAHTQFLLGGTLPVFERFDPRALARPLDEGGPFTAFLRRTEPPFTLKPPNAGELKKIAQERIDLHRKEREGPFIPFDEDAIMLAWKTATQNLGLFTSLLQAMYDLALAEGAARITKAHCEGAAREVLPAE
jgi:hypothetical protein